MFLIFLLDSKIFDLVHLLLDLVHAKTLLEGVSGCRQLVKLLLDFHDVGLGVSFLELLNEFLHDIFELYVSHGFVLIGLRVAIVFVWQIV